MGKVKGLLKNAHLLRCTSNRTAQRILNIRLAIRLLRALYLSIFEQPMTNFVGWNKRSGSTYVFNRLNFREVFL